MSKKKIYSYKGKVGDTEVHIVGRGKNFKAGMEFLGNVIADESHKFICLKCGELWKGDTFNPFFKGCPSCGVPEGEGRGCYSEMGGDPPDRGIHGIWENHYGLTNETYNLLKKENKTKRLSLAKKLCK